MTSDIAVYPAALSAGRCQQIIGRADELPVFSGTVGTAQGYAVDESIRKSNVRWFSDSAANQDLFEDLWRYIRRANAGLWGYHVDFLGDIQFTEYDGSEEGRYDWHEDSTHNPDAPYVRKLSAVVQLSDPLDYEGGDFEVQSKTQPDPQQLRLRGTVIVFRSCVRHRVAKVVKGCRRSLVAWAQGPRQR